MRAGEFTKFRVEDIDFEERCRSIVILLLSRYGRHMRRRKGEKKIFTVVADTLGSGPEQLPEETFRTAGADRS
jgi:hypothetical protein